MWPQLVVMQVVTLSIYVFFVVNVPRIRLLWIVVRVMVPDTLLVLGTQLPLIGIVQTLPEYQVNGGKYDINFWIKPIGSH